jgi:hypothetical protein
MRCQKCGYGRKTFGSPQWIWEIRHGLVPCGCGGTMMEGTPIFNIASQAAAKLVAYLIIMGGVLIVALILGALGAK